MPSVVRVRDEMGKLQWTGCTLAYFFDYTQRSNGSGCDNIELRCSCLTRATARLQTARSGRYDSLQATHIRDHPCTRAKTMKKYNGIVR